MNSPLMISSILLSLLVIISSSETTGYDDVSESSLVDEVLSPSYDEFYHITDKRDSMPGVLRFGKRAQSFVRFGKRLSGIEKKEMPGVLRFGKRSEKKSVPALLRKVGKEYGVLRFGKRSDMPGVLRFGKKSVPGVLRFGRK